MTTCTLPWQFSPSSGDDRVDQSRHTNYMSRMDVGAYVPDHRDIGCEYSPRCLECTLQVCQYEARAKGGRKPGLHGRELQALLPLVSGRVVSAPAMANRMGVTTKTVHEVIGRIRRRYGRTAILSCSRGYTLHPDVLREVLG